MDTMSGPTQQLPDDHGDLFCYLYIRQPAEAIVALGILALGVLLVGKAARQYRNARKFGVLTKTANLVYLVIFLWAIMFLCKVVMSQILYLLFYGKTDQDQASRTELSSYSKGVFVVDICGSFLVQTILVLIPYNWMYRIILFFQQISGLEQRDSAETPINYLRFEEVCVRLLKFYLFIRAVFFLLIVPFLIIKDDAKSETILVQIMFALLLAEAGFVLVILVLGLMAIIRNSKLRELVEESEIATMRNQYIILIICSLSRLIIDIVVVVLRSTARQEDRCVMSDFDESLRVPRILEVVAEGILTHYLPIFITLRLFHIEKTEISLTGSLIRNSEQEHQN